ncbi:MAG: hypothetical protein WBA01_06800, partial [Phormidesmis sp.]
LSTEALSTEALSTEALSTEALSAETLSTDELIEQAQLRGVDLFSTEPYYYAPQQSLAARKFKREFIFGFGSLDEAAIDEAIARLRPLFLP